MEIVLYVYLKLCKNYKKKKMFLVLILILIIKFDVSGKRMKVLYYIFLLDFINKFSNKL